MAAPNRAAASYTIAGGTTQTRNQFNAIDGFDIGANLGFNLSPLAYTNFPVERRAAPGSNI